MHMMQNAMPMAYEGYAGGGRRGGPSRAMAYGDVSYAQTTTSTSKLMPTAIPYTVPTPRHTPSFWASELQNFMKIQPLQVFNLKPNEQGEVIYRNDTLRNYSNLLIVVADKESVAQHFCSLDEASDTKC
jgi:hypothetical protein